MNLRTFNFNETRVVKMSKGPQPPLGGMFGNKNFGHLANIRDPTEKDIDEIFSLFQPLVYMSKIISV